MRLIPSAAIPSSLIRLSACLLFAMAAPVASAQAASPIPSGINCQLDPVRGTVCGLGFGISGSAGASAAGEFLPLPVGSSGPNTNGFLYQPSFTYVGSASDTEGLNGSSAGASAEGFVTFGQIRNKAAASAWTTGQLNGWHATSVVNSTLSFQDSLTFSHPTLNGTLGKVYGLIEIDGGLNATSTGGSTNSSASVSINANGAGPTASVFSASTVGSSSGSIPNLLVVELPVFFGKPHFTGLYVGVYVSAAAHASNVFGVGLGADGVSDYFSTLEWAGIDRVVDGLGNTVTGWSVSSASGFDYSRSFASQVTPVPEPSAYALMAAGLAILTLKIRRRILTACIA